ncbi:MAG: hypothetical protein ABIH82_06405 [Candidatus Woesearchaeota archaeon]
MKKIIILIITICLLMVGCSNIPIIGELITSNSPAAGDGADTTTTTTTTSGASSTGTTSTGTTVTDCGEDQSCFEDKFADCEPAKFKAKLMDNLIYNYEIKGVKEGRCEVKSDFTANPNPEFVGITMVCLYDHSLAFEDAVKDTSLCTGQLAVKMGLSAPECTNNAECDEGKLCIDEQCKTLNDVYEKVENCPKYCNYDSVQFSTSDGESYNLKRGEGSYSYAGALEWKVKSLPSYCEGQAPKVALQLLKKNAGKVLEETYLTLSVGTASKTITHPTITRVQFTATVNSINEVCS